MGVTRRTTSNTEDAEPDEAASRSSSIPSSRGWGAAKQTVKENKSSEYADDFKITEEEILVKFPEDEPFFSTAEHWINEIEEGKKSFFCPKKARGTCALCGTGHKPKAKAFFNIVPLQGDEAGTAMRLPAGPLLLDALEEANDSRQGPLSRHYWGISKSVSGSGKRGKVSYHLRGYKDADLSSDWETDPDAVSALLSEVTLYDESSIVFPTDEDLKDIRDEHLTDKK